MLYTGVLMILKDRKVQAMQRYFIEEANDQTEVTVTGDDFHHMTRVMRMNPGDTFYGVIDKKTAIVSIEAIHEKTLSGRIIDWVEETKELPIHVTIANGLPKGDKLEWIIQKGTELGAHGFIPFNATRSIVKWDSKKAGKKTERLRKIAKEAAEQSHRTEIPSVADPVEFRGLLEHAISYDYKLIAYEEDAKQGEASQLASTIGRMVPGQSLLIVFGPEGGLDAAEVNQLLENGFRTCGLGPRILRTETAPLYALAAISYQLELAR